MREIFNFLEKKNILKNSIIIITADHGESLGEHKLFDHNDLYYNILHVPLIVKIPEHEGRNVNYSASSVDIFPTIIDLLGYESERQELQLRGKNLFKKRGEEYIQFSEGPIGTRSYKKDGDCI